MELYPLKFTPILKEKIWGGTRLETLLGKACNGKNNIGESWELSAFEENISVVSNGNLAGNDLNELIEIYMGDLVGEKVFDEFGYEFPLLIKFLDANEDLSIQVHPNDDYAFEKHELYGKTEMWYVLHEEENVEIIKGFIKDIDKSTFISMLNNNTLPQILNREVVKKGDVVFVPAGTVHTLCKGNLVVEIQQTSDLTYRIYDYDRVDNKGNKRELHLEDALEVINFTKTESAKTEYKTIENQPVEIASCPYFTADILEINAPLLRDYYSLDSFVILICVEGECTIHYNGELFEPIKKGETVLLPAAIVSVVIKPISPVVRLLETYIK